MSAQGHPARAPAPTRGAEALALAALTNLWRSMEKVLPLWFALALFHTLVHAQTHTAGDNVWPLQAILENEASTVTSLVVSGLSPAVSFPTFPPPPPHRFYPPPSLAPPP